MISFIRRLRFIISYSFAELFPVQILNVKPQNLLESVRESIHIILYNFGRWTPAILNVLSLAIVAVTILVMWGLMAGTTAGIKKSLEDNPRILCIDAFAANAGGEIGVINKEAIEKLEKMKMLDGKVVLGPGPNATQIVEKVCGWNDVLLRYYKKNGELGGDYTDGRTFLPNDKILSQIVLENKVSLKAITPETEGVIVSRGLLKELGYGKENPKHLCVQYKSKRVPIKVLGVANNLWNGQFLVPEYFQQKMLALKWVPIRHYTNFYWGPFDGPDAKKLSQAVAKLYDPGLIKASMQERSGSKVWLHFVLGKNKHWSQDYIANVFIAGVAKNLAQKDQATFKKGGLVFEDSLEDRSVGEFTPKAQDYLAISIYLNKMEAVIPAVRAIRKLGLQCDSRVSEDILWAEQLETFAGGISQIVILCVALLAIANIYLSFMKKAQETIPEIGVLKAFGISNATISIIQMTEAIIIWCLAFPIGLLCAVYAGGMVKNFLASTFQIPNGIVVIKISTKVLLCTALGTLLVTIATSSVATFFVSKHSPAEALRFRK